MESIIWLSKGVESFYHTVRAPPQTSPNQISTPSATESVTSSYNNSIIKF